MVSGIVRPPALDLANRDLVEAHLHAVWLAESGKELAYEIPRVLELPDPALPVQKDIADVFADPELAARSAQSMRRILGSIDGELTPEAAPWAADRQKLAESVAAAAPSEFSRAFRRWRGSRRYLPGHGATAGWMWRQASPAMMKGRSCRLPTRPARPSAG
jgi:hypothetical protein